MNARLYATAIIAAALVPGAVLAQSSNQPMGRMNSAMESGQGAQLPQDIKDKLQQLGLSDVKIVPRSFIVSAKDKNGDDVNMIIGPHSMLIMTESSTTGTTGSRSGSGTSNK
jgi:hypothetical protein